MRIEVLICIFFLAEYHVKWNTMVSVLSRYSRSVQLRPHNKLETDLMNHLGLIWTNYQNDQTLAGVPAMKGNDLLFISASEFWGFLASFLPPTFTRSLQPFILNKSKGKVSQIQDFRGAIPLANRLYSWQILKYSAYIKDSFRIVNYEIFQS